ncbi:MAG: FAD-dependent oxidoreductase, partial [Treponema sp.]|nr:FAD-dependent oxidoreductase [Treponema sp.]
MKWAEKKIPLAGEYDLFIAGGGCAGSGAAVAAGRSGIKTFLAERLFALGGTMTSGLMSKIAISSPNHSIAEELIKRMDARQKSNFLSSRHEVPVDPEHCKWMLDRMVIDEAGTDVRFGTVVCDVIANGYKIDDAVVRHSGGVEIHATSGTGTKIIEQEKDGYY